MKSTAFIFPEILSIIQYFTLYEKGLLGTRNPEALLNTLWLNSTMHFGLRGCKEHRDMCWGDVKLKETADGKECLEFNERQTKTRTGSDCRDIRAMPPKMFATDGSEKDPIVVYKLYAQTKEWFKSGSRFSWSCWHKPT